MLLFSLFFTSADERARCGYDHSNLGELSEGFSHLNKDAVAPRRSSLGYSSLPRRNSKLCHLEPNEPTAWLPADAN